MTAGVWMYATGPDRRGLPVVSRLRWIPLPAARVSLRLLGLGHLPIASGVALRRVLYATTGVDGRPTVASGLVGRAPHAVVGYQHGTQGHRLNVPSTPHRLEGVLTSMVFAGAGYVFVAPDYLGLGSAWGPHPYLHAPTEAGAVVDLLDAVPEVLHRTGTPVPERAALLGFSQGGHATLAALAELGAGTSRLEVVGAASVAGVHRLFESAGPHTLSGVSPHHATYLAYLATAYSRIYRRPLSSIARPAWVRRLPRLMDGSHGLMEVERALPRDPTLVLTRETVEDLLGRGEGWFARRLKVNSVGDLATRVPVRLYTGSRDVDAPPSDAHLTAELLRGRGSRVDVVDVGPHDHRGTAFEAVGRARRWFDELFGTAVPTRPA
ncbi:lipase family protein [Ornithinimicrobium humiphilum]|nr:lipase family protein [Ornithinimicrobium humiphilum]